MKVYFNTNSFERFIKKERISTTTYPHETSLLVLGAKKVNFNDFLKLKAVYRFGVGSENINFELLKKRSIPVYFPSEKTKKIMYDATADFTVYGILKLLYKNAFGDINLWRKFNRDHIVNKIALVIGTGNIGKLVVRKLKVFMKVRTYDIQNNNPEELESLIREADIITVHIPLNAETKNFFGERELSWVKDDAIIVNTARGGLFEEKAFYRKLKNTDCRAFFDVFWEEPYKGKLKSLGKDKFFMTPHSASNTKEFIRAGFNDIVEIMEKLRKCSENQEKTNAIAQ